MIEDAPVTDSVQKAVAPFRRNLDKTLSMITKKPPSRFPENKAITTGGGVGGGGEKVGVGRGTVVIPSPQAKALTRYMVPGSAKCLQIENETCLSAFGRLTQVKLIMAGNTLWEIILGCSVCVFTANSSLVALACTDGSLHVMDTVSGTKVVPAMVLGAAAAHLALCGTKLLCVTSHGRLNVWCLEGRTSLVSDKSVQPIMGSTGRISRCSVTKAGAPTVVLDSGRAYMYSLEFNTWMRLADNTDPAVRNTQRSYQSAWQSMPDNGQVPLRTVQAHCHNSAERGLMHRMENTASCTQSFLEEQLTICKALNSATEFRFWFITNIRFLLQEGLESRLRLVCESLMREASEADLNCLWNPTTLGIDRLSLLRDVLNEMSTSSQAQRMYMEFNEQLKYLT